MMTRLEITAAIEQIRAKVHRDDVLDAKPVAAKWKPTPPFVVLANPHAGRGHVDYHPKDAKSKTLIACAKCLQDKPRGGWSESCPAGLPRVFMGGSC